MDFLDRQLEIYVCMQQTLFRDHMELLKSNHGPKSVCVCVRACVILFNVNGS